MGTRQGLKMTIHRIILPEQGRTIRHRPIYPKQSLLSTIIALGHNLRLTGPITPCLLFHHPLHGRHQSDNSLKSSTPGITLWEQCLWTRLGDKTSCTAWSLC
jgi:hypothetical protein